jgi:hypothetical protein
MDGLERALTPVQPLDESSYLWRRKLFFDHLDDGNAWRVVKRVKQLYIHDDVETEWRL